MVSHDDSSNRREGPGANGADGIVVAPPFAIREAIGARTPFVFASPHSGRVYPARFVAESRLHGVDLRRSEDAFVDWIFGAAPDYGAPLITARFPRAFVDANRGPREIDAQLFAEPLGDVPVDDTPHLRAGYGVVPRVVAADMPIHVDRLTLDEVRARIARHHEPYHAALRELVDDTRARFGVCFLIDCHSMPSTGHASGTDGAAESPVDVILGDRHGVACAVGLSDAVEAILREQGFSVRRNAPYAGAYTAAHYGRPDEGVHAIQIELSRGLYMDEPRMVPGPGLRPLIGRIEAFLAALTSRNTETLTRR